MSLLDDYERRARAEMEAWRARMLRGPNLFDRAAKGVQNRVTAVIPEKVHQAITAVIERMVRGVLAGSDVVTGRPLLDAALAEREARVRKRIEAWRTTAAVEGGVAGAGGLVLAAADFPALIAIKIKLLFDIAALYGRETDAFSERLFVLSVFQLAFSSPDHRRQVFEGMADWDATHARRPATFAEFDWRRFQQEYRDHIDLAKLAQMLPLIGAPVGAAVNYRMLDRLGATAMNSHRMRWFEGRARPPYRP